MISFLKVCGAGIEHRCWFFKNLTCPGDFITWSLVIVPLTMNDKANLVQIFIVSLKQWGYGPTTLAEEDSIAS